jgi:hypothetical protein
MSVLGLVMYSCTATEIMGGTFSKAAARAFRIQWIWSSQVLARNKQVHLNEHTTVADGPNKEYPLTGILASSGSATGDISEKNVD